MDVIWTLQYLLDAPQFGGCVDNSLQNLQEAYESLRWEDERPKPTWAELEAAWPAAQKTIDLQSLNQQLEEAFVSVLPKHLGQPYLTNDLMISISGLKLIVTDYNRLKQYALSKGMIAAITLPAEMEADRAALLALYP